MATAANNVDEYIAGFSIDIQARLEQIRTTIKKSVPEAEETIKYAIPTFVFHGNMVSFAAFKNHIGIYPVPAGDQAFEQEIAGYKASKSTARFLHNETLPLKLITRFVKFRAQAMLEKSRVNKK